MTAALIVGILAGYPLGALYRSHTTARALRRANFRVERLLGACNRLEAENTSLREFITVVADEDWGAEL